MGNILRTSAFLAALLLFCGVSAAQENAYVSASLESNTILYVKDKATGTGTPQDRFGSNNYAKLDYYRGRFSAGIQMEGYLPVQQNYPAGLEGLSLTNYYLSWTDEDFSVTAGSFYEQFGSGLLFRSWEDRMLGFNNAILGVKAGYSFRNIVNLRAFIGMPRLGMEYMKTQLRGADLQFNISELSGWDNMSLSLEGSLLSRYEPVIADIKDVGGEPNTTGYSGRVNFSWKGLSLRGEYVDAGDKFISNYNYEAVGDPRYLKRRGNAQLVELGYNSRGLGINLNLRRLEWMGSKIISNTVMYEGNPLLSSDANILNYLPALCTQYTYLLTTLHPYTPETGRLGYKSETNCGEMGGQFDVFYNFRRGTALGGKYGMKVHANFSTYYSIKSEQAFKPHNMLYRDLSVDVEKKFSKNLKLLVLWSMQEKNQSYGANRTTHLQNIFVADLLYKFTPTISGRFELQYLTTKEDEKDWMAALAEFSFAPKWSVWVSDMYNHGLTGKHYYNAGVSYARSRTRVAIGYGRYKGGSLCSGGVCRTISPYTGANFSITTSF